MRASTDFWLGGVVCCLLLTSLSGCHKEVKADFPRPPATAALPAPEAPPEDAAPPPAEEPEPPVEVSEEPPEPPQPRPKPVATSKPPRAHPEPDAEEPPVEEEPTSTQISGTGEEDPEIVTKLRRVDALFESLGDRKLTAEQAQQLTAAEAFVAQARKAIQEGDPRRALVLIDKGLILAQDLERLSRP
jgi:hypothetical protein